MSTNLIDSIVRVAEESKNDKVVLLKSKSVVQWLFGDLSFLQSTKTEFKNNTERLKYMKCIEDEWGKEMCKVRRPDLKFSNQRTNKFGEHLCEEIYILLGKQVSVPPKKGSVKPDIETDDEIIEVKTQTYYTSGTAGEKILGCPFKYCQVPTLYEKPLYIVCLGGAERVCERQYKIFDASSRRSSGIQRNSHQSGERMKFIKFYKDQNIHYMKATDLLKSLIN